MPYFTVYNQHLRQRNPLCFNSFKCFELSYCSSTDFDGFSGTCEQLNIPTKNNAICTRLEVFAGERVLSHLKNA